MTQMPNRAFEPRSKTKPPCPTSLQSGGIEENSVGDDACKRALLEDTVAALKRAGHKLCILHGYEKYPEHIDSDIDAISEAPSQISHILARGGVATTVQVFQHETTAFYYILYRACEGRPTFVALDVSADYRRNGRIFFEGEEFLETSKPFKFFEVPSTELEFAYYLVKKVAKGSLSEVHTRRLGRLYDENPAGCEQELLRFFPQKEIRLIAEAARSGDWGPLHSRLGNLRRTMLTKVGREQPLQVLRYWLGDLQRRARRILQPTGLMVVFLGADGSGKSTVMAQVERELGPIFRGVRRRHLRPRLVLRRITGTGPVTDPHAKLPRSMAASLAKLGLWGIDYTAGYLVDIFPLLVRSNLVLFDRYYHDLLVDTRRYRYGAPLWLARFVGRFIPHPHLVILLDAEPEVLQARKQEVPLEETARQRGEYLKLIRGLPNGHIVDASKPLEEVVLEVETAILGYMAKRTARRLGWGEGE